MLTGPAELGQGGLPFEDTAPDPPGQRSSEGPPPPWSGVPGRRMPIAAATQTAAPPSPPTASPGRPRAMRPPPPPSTPAGVSATPWTNASPPKPPDPEPA